MFARVTVVQAPPGRVDEGIRYVRDHVIPVAQQQRGIKGGYWLTDRKRGKTLAITLWESEETLKASEAAIAKIREESAKAIGATFPSVEVYEVTNRL